MNKPEWMPVNPYTVPQDLNGDIYYNSRYAGFEDGVKAGQKKLLEYLIVYIRDYGSATAITKIESMLKQLEEQK